nr:hypothetical protein [Tanacetum cinerariifolium]
VAALITNDFGDDEPTRDIVVNKKDIGPKRILELHPSYMALQYPLLFLYGDDGYHDKILYHNNIDMFITITLNLKWPKINEMLEHMPGWRAHDRPEVVTMVFKLKLTELLDDLTKNQVFGESRAVVYVIEFQKRGLPHADILLWFKENCKCKTPGDINDIILAELPSSTDDPTGYKAVTDDMLHGPCGEDARYVSCNVKGKCLKHFPKPLYEEIIINQDGYPIYRRRDNAVTF